MKPTRAIFAVATLAALLAAGTGRADDKPAEPKHNVIAVSVRSTLVKGEQGKPTGDRPNQVPQYGFVTTLAHYGFQVESRVPTGWDKLLLQSKVTLNPPAPPLKPGEKPPEKKDEKKAAAPDFTIEGTIELEYSPLQFWDKTRDLAIFYVEKVNVKIKDGTGKEIKTISWSDIWGANNDMGHKYVLDECEKRAACFLMNDFFHVKELTDQIPEAQRAEFTKFMKDEDEYRAKMFDDASKKKAPVKDAKGEDEKK